MKRKINILFLVLAIILLLLNMYRIDLNDLGWEKNSGAYLSGISNILLVMLFVTSLKKFTNEKN